jgi:tubulin polyglutamylase TTLL6/13
MRMKKLFPEDYNFFPKTWILPNEAHDLTSYYWQNNTGNKKKINLTFIVKPDNLCQGKGIFLSKSIDHIFSITMDHSKKNEFLDEN